MSLMSRITNVFRRDRLHRELVEELESHLAEALEQGRDPAEARRALGHAHEQRRHMQESHDARALPWLDFLRADVIFGWRQLMKRKATTAVAVLSLGLAIGACTSAYRLIDAFLFRPLPITDPTRLYVALHQGAYKMVDSTSYPMFRQMRASVKGEAELIAVSYVTAMDLTYRSDQEMEKAQVQYVSGTIFSSFGLQPALGRLFTQSDDEEPGVRPYAVISYDYWTSRFARDPNVIGRTFRMGDNTLQIIGVSGKAFYGTETGLATEVFVPMMMMNLETLNHPDAFWFRTFVRPNPGTLAAPLRDRLAASYTAWEHARLKGSTKSDAQVLRFELESAAEGVSGMQKLYRPTLIILGVLVVMVLLIACANVANLMTAQATSRAREMALRVSIGAGRQRLVQMVMVENAMLAALSAALGAAFAWWAAPFVVSQINPPDNPARIALPFDWKILAFGLLLTFAVTLLFGLAPALRASSVKPVAALKGEENPRQHQWMMHSLIGAQVAFCFLVVFLASLFVKTFEHLSEQPLGFSPERLLILQTIAHSAQSTIVWDQMVDHIRTIPQVEAASMAMWPLISGMMSNTNISVNGEPSSKTLAYFLRISPGWAGTMKIPFAAGRDFRQNDEDPRTAIVNKAFAREYLHGQNPVGRSFAAKYGGTLNHYEIVGMVEDSAYRDVREAMLPIAYTPMRGVNPAGLPKPLYGATFVIRTRVSDPTALADTLRKEISRLQPETRVYNVLTQMELIRAQTIRERLLAQLASFFAGVALLLAFIGLYGVLNYSVLQRERELGIRIAIGAGRFNIARLVTLRTFAMVLMGAVAGLALGVGASRYVATLLFGVKPTDVAVLLWPTAILLTAALLASIPAVIRAASIDPAVMLKAE
jgi:putative ABC transport system permease protein